MTRTLYEDIARRMTLEDSDDNVTDTLSVLDFYVRDASAPLYVNEIKNFLEQHSNELFVKYGRLFSGLLGCYEAFGMASDTAALPRVPYVAKQRTDSKIAKPKCFEMKIKRRGKNLIKKQAREQAIQKYHERFENKAESKMRRAEFEELVRKENGG